MTQPALHLVLPGPLDRRSGGTLYDVRMVRGLGRLGWQVTVHGLEGRFPDTDARARGALEGVLAGIPDGARVVIDGLAMGDLPEVLRPHGERLHLVALVHHPLADETGLDPSTRARFAAREAEAWRWCAGLVVTSPFTAGRAREYGVPEARVRVALPGTDPAPPASGPGPGAPPALLCVGSVTPRKGHDVLVGALARIRHLPWSCACAGSLEWSPAHVQTVRERIRDEELEDRVRLLGERDRAALERLYDASSLFVLASRYEGYGMALAEALARGLPVVSTTGGAIPSTVPEGAGILVPPGDEPALAAALEGLLQVAEEPGDAGGDPGRRRRARLAAAARRHAARLPGWDEAAAAFAGAVLELTADGEAR